MTEKETLRKAARQKRIALGESFRVAASVRICENVQKSPEYQTARHILCYAAVNSEASLEALIKDILCEGKKLLLPKVDPAEDILKIYIVEDLGHLRPGAYGIPEPDESCRPADIDSIDLALVPLTAFDNRGRRLGSGKGYYDRFLPLLRTCPKWGAAFSAQRVETIPAEAHDIRLDAVVTEEGIVHRQ